MLKKIFEPLKFGPFNLKNKIAMASLTRCRADPLTGNPNDLMKEYYTDRAKSAGLVLTECVYTRLTQNGFIGAGGLETLDNARHWRPIVDSVHKENSVFFAQIFHSGRMLHPKHHGT